MQAPEDALRKRAMYDRERRKRHAATLNKRARVAYDKARDDLYLLLGNKCARCGYEDRRALQFDHIHGGGSAELKKGGGGATRLRKWLADPDIKSKIQILCANCNQIKKIERREFGPMCGNCKPRKYIN